MKRWKAYTSFLLILIMLTVSLSGCALVNNRPPAQEESTAEEYQNYDKYDEASIKEQNAFEEFTDQIFRDEISENSLNLHYTLMYPENYGLSLDPPTLGDYSLEKMRQNAQGMKDMLTELESFDTGRLSIEQLLTYNILHDYITVELQADGLELYAQPLAATIGLQAQLPVLLAEYRFSSKTDVDQYLLLISQVDDLFNQILEMEKEKSAAGIFLSDSAIERVVDSCKGAMTAAAANPLTETFGEKLGEVQGLTDKQRDTYLQEHTRILNEDFIPAYQMLTDGLNALKGTGTNEYGLSYYDQGKQYYEYLVASMGCSYTVPELKEKIQLRMDSDYRAISALVEEDPDLYNRILDPPFLAAEPNAILESLKVQIQADFPPIPSDCTYTVKKVAQSLESTLSPAFYVVPPIDDYRNNSIFINGFEDFASSSLYNTLAHEGFPGHLYQNVYFISRNPNKLRHVLTFPAYSEGWATYTEYLSYGFDNGLDPKLAQTLAHNASGSLAIYALLDICINYEGWNREEAGKYLESRFGIRDADTQNSVYNALIDSPGNYLEYYAGYLEIQEMREEAEETLGAAFSPLEFHCFLLDMGPASFRTIRQYFNGWLLSSRQLK